MVEKRREYISDSSGEEDGDAEWKATIYSVASTSSFANGFSASSTPNVDSTAKRPVCSSNNDDDDIGDLKPKPRMPKHYQIKAQKLLDDIIEKNLVVVKDSADVLYEDPMTSEVGIRLFKHAPPGIVFDHFDEIQGPKERPRLLPGKEIDEKSKKFRQQLKSVAIDGKDIIAAARDVCQKSLARLEAKDAAAKASAKREEKRVAKLKSIRGERWLPSIAKEMQLKSQG